MDEAGINVLLIGDSLGQVMLGYEDTLSVTMDEMIHHTAAVARGAKNAFILADMPFMSYQASIYDAVTNAGRLMKEGRANGVKLEGGATVCEQIRAIVDDRNEKIGRKIRDNELKRIPYMLIVGEKEAENREVSVRKQGEGDKGSMKIATFAALLNGEIDEMMNRWRTNND